MSRNGAAFLPIICSMQKMALYETKSKYYLVGSNNTQSRFRVLKIDRQEPNALEIYDDKVEYSADEIHDLVNMIDSGNRRAGGGLSRVISAFGIVGFIKFLEGYYIILITKRRKVAVIGHHTIYKIEDTTMIYIPHDSVKIAHPEEPRYLKMFQSIDLASNFYFSYSYDLTHTLQHNLTEPKQFVVRNSEDCEIDESLLNDKDLLTSSIISNESKLNADGSNEEQLFGIRSQPFKKFVWNLHLLDEALKADLHPDWVLYITHGFIGQNNINVFGRSLYLTLIARRSSKYAGTRFLKRGANFQGDVANEVETEQMLHDSGISSLSHSHITSFVQMRGSIPGHWKQEMGKMVAKPAITIDFHDPFAETAGAHFNELLKRYGAPIVVLNLVKQRERKKQESMLSDILSSAVKYLNEFLPVEHRIIYKTFDMARKNKSSTNVMGYLAGIARNAVMKVGIFHNKPKYFSQRNSTLVGQNQSEIGSRQTGIVRTNCVDCLDRTNTAQFAIGKCVLGYQLCALGVLDTPNLEFDTDCVRILESLYEDHGDTLALQYGGSQLVHRIKTYRKTSPWTSQGNDIMQTLSRYYSNTFSDAEKQNAINLFLGLFKPDEHQPQIWDFPSDYYFHHKPNLFNLKSFTQWWDSGVYKCLPYSYNDLTKACFELIQVHSKDIEMIDSYLEFYRPYEFSNLDDVYAIKISNSVRDFMPNCTTNYSPFTVRVRPVKRREGVSQKGHTTMKNPSVTGQSSTSSTYSSSSSSSDDSSEVDESLDSYELHTVCKESFPEPVTFKSLFPDVQEVYGFQIKEPSKEDMLIYKKYVLTGKRASGTAVSFSPSNVNIMKPISCFTNDSSISVVPPKVSQKSIEIYSKYVELGRTGKVTLKPADLEIYRRYACLR